MTEHTHNPSTWKESYISNNPPLHSSRAARLLKTLTKNKTKHHQNHNEIISPLPQMAIKREINASEDPEKTPSEMSSIQPQRKSKILKRIKT